MEQITIKGFRLSPQQEYVWLLQQTNSATYRARCIVLIEGNLEIEILEMALKDLVARHEILRTTFQSLDGVDYPVQSIAEECIVPLTLHDLSTVDPQHHEARTEAILEEMSEQPFDFEFLPLLRVSLIRLASYKHALAIVLPVLCADLTSLGNIVGEIRDVYAIRRGNEVPKGETMQYADFAEWQNELLETDDAFDGREFWRKQDFGILQSLKLPFESWKSEKGSFEPECASIAISSDTLARIEKLASDQSVSISSVLLAWWYGLLWKLTGQSSFAIGYGSNGRNYGELETAVGLFAKYLPLSCQLESKLRFTDLVKQTDLNVREAIEKQEFFDCRQFKPYSNDAPPFPIAFDFITTPTIKVTSDVSFTIDWYCGSIDHHKLRAACIYAADSLIVEFYYDPASCSTKEINRLAGQYRKGLETACHNPEIAIGDIEILTDAERERLLVEFTNTTGRFSDTCVHRLFEKQAEKTPDAISVRYECQHLTYRELNSRANQLAHYLRQLGVGPEVRVAICLERSLEMIVGLLGIIKAGAAYVPLDPGLPRHRLEFMLEESAATIVITEQQFMKNLSGLVPELICLDSENSPFANLSEENLIGGATAQNLVYVIFTSGSTGEPKGVALEHRQLANYIHAILDRLDLPQGSSFAMVSTLATDLGNTALFPSLCSGGLLHIVSTDRATDPDALADYFSINKIDCLKIVPSHLSALLTSSRSHQVLPRKRLVLGGEACSTPLMERIQALAPDCVVFNHYGPTEATIGAITHRVDRDEVKTRLPLGRPISNTQIYILDDRLNPTPIGIAGELHIAGEGLARGYLDRPDLTAERFIPNAFSASQGARLYKTGDRAKYREDGRIEFLGRLDNQVKIRGYRIELGEIESVLAMHPSVKECAVAVSGGDGANNQLVGFIVKEEGEAFYESELQSYLKKSLPDYMIPGCYVVLEKMPLTAAGKLNRLALPNVQGHSGTPLQKDLVAPRTPVEEQLAEIWKNLLNLERISIFDNFFALGGDSIMSIRIIARANEAGLRLTPRQLFQNQTIAELAQVATVSHNVEINQHSVNGAIPLTPIQRRFFEPNLAQPHHYNQSVMLEVPLMANRLVLEEAIRKLLIHHDALRLRFSREPSGWRQYVADIEEGSTFSYVDLSSLPASEQQSAIEKIASELQASLSLTEGPLVRTAFFELGPGNSGRLLMISHHLAVDWVSWQILLDDLQSIYQQLIRGESILLPARTTSFKEWSEQLIKLAESKSLHAELPYWLDNARREVKGLPMDYTNGINSVTSARTLSFSLNTKETSALLQDVPKAYNTQINDALLTALTQTITEWTGEPGLLVDLEAHGREEITKEMDLSRTVGWFTTVFPLLLNMKLSPRPGDTLKSIKEQIRGVPNRGIGYGILRYMCAVGSRLADLPQADIAFNYLGQLEVTSGELSCFRRAKEPRGPSQSADQMRRYLLTINGCVIEGTLKFDWTYSENVHRRDTIELLGQSFVEALQKIISHCRSCETAEYTPSDFPKAKLSQRDLDNVLKKFGKSSARTRN